MSEQTIELSPEQYFLLVSQLLNGSVSSDIFNPVLESELPTESILELLTFKGIQENITLASVVLGLNNHTNSIDDPQVYIDVIRQLKPLTDDPIINAIVEHYINREGTTSEHLLALLPLYGVEPTKYQLIIDKLIEKEPTTDQILRALDLIYPKKRADVPLVKVRITADYTDNFKLRLLNGIDLNELDSNETIGLIEKLFSESQKPVTQAIRDYINKLINSLNEKEDFSTKHMAKVLSFYLSSISRNTTLDISQLFDKFLFESESVTFEELASVALAAEFSEDTRPEISYKIMELYLRVCDYSYATPTELINTFSTFAQNDSEILQELIDKLVTHPDTTSENIYDGLVKLYPQHFVCREKYIELLEKLVLHPDSTGEQIQFFAHLLSELPTQSYLVALNKVKLNWEQNNGKIPDYILPFGNKGEDVSPKLVKAVSALFLCGCLIKGKTRTLLQELPPTIPLPFDNPPNITDELKQNLTLRVFKLI